ncbi:DUF5329 domain-containing protein [Pseudomonas sp. PDM14]|uniref:DUF5329 domain-containing protein n=1 Tax=Pseudomonas sp. PDM14 TaxID=2769288 RepID=UPI001CE1A661|nr:DUF5329 domain-containing protein [Pseudomonas sp. PDM14]
MKSQHYLRPLCASALLITSITSVALPNASQQEIDALLRFVEDSGCTFIRNSTEHDSRDAKAHLQKKLDYLKRKELVDSTEDFITRAATESSFSGTAYEVDCNGHKLRSADWLNQELQRLRQD